MAFFIPALGMRQVTAWVDQERYQAAHRLAQVLRWLHPADGWRDYPTLLKAMALAQQGDMQQAIALLDRYRSPITPIGRLATVLSYRLEGRWADLLAWVHDHNFIPQLRYDLSLMTYYVRALGETGDLNQLIDTVESYSPQLERLGNSRTLNVFRLFVFAFCGQVDALQRLFQRSFKTCAPAFRHYWQGIAELSSGHHETGRQRLLTLQTTADSILGGAIARHLTQPLIEPDQILSEAARKRLAQIEIDGQQEQRYGRLFTFFNRTAYGTYGLISLNLLIFGVEEARGGSENLDTLYNLGALVPEEVWQGEWWRLIAANFLHYGLLHLVMNMLGLYLLGGFVEAAIGLGRYLLVYFMSGVGAMGVISLLAVVFHSSDELLVGASAAIMGLVGATVVMMVYGWRRERSRLAARNLRILLFVVALQTLFDLTTPGVSALGHFLGLIWGAGITSVLLQRQHHIKT